MLTLQASQLISRMLRIRRQAQHTKRHLHVTQRIALEYFDSRDASLHRAALLSDGDNRVGRRNIPPLGAAMDETDLFEGISRYGGNQQPISAWRCSIQ